MKAMNFASQSSYSSAKRSGDAIRRTRTGSSTREKRRIKKPPLNIVEKREGGIVRELRNSVRAGRTDPGGRSYDRGRAAVAERRRVEVDGEASLRVHRSDDPVLARAYRGLLVVQVQVHPAGDVNRRNVRRENGGVRGGRDRSLGEKPIGWSAERIADDAAGESEGILVLVEADHFHGCYRAVARSARAGLRSEGPTFAPDLVHGLEGRSPAFDPAD